MPHITLDWLADHVQLPQDLTVSDLAADLVRVGLEDEQITVADITGPVVIGRVVSVEAEPQKNGKVINWCHVDVGQHNVHDESGEPTIPRGIVCGAHNFRPGDLVPTALDGAILPGPFPISARKTYGHISDGMICSAAELGLGDDHDGIIVLERFGFTADAGYDLTPGRDALQMFGLSDEVLEVNVTPDRGYCFSVRGIAREFSHSTGAPFTDLGLPSVDLPAATADGFAVEVDDQAPLKGLVGCERFVARIVRGIDPTAQSPAWMQRRLTQAGMRPISLTVDITNYVMLDLGQPLHAYDLATLTAPIVVRRASAGEKITTLDEAERTLNPEDLLITDSTGGHGANLLGIAGVMGGATTEVSDSTTDVLIEAAHFDPISIARTARRHRLPSEAAKRFERWVDPQLAPVAAQRVVDLLVEYGGGTADAAVTDLDNSLDPAPVLFPLSEPERLIGVAYTDEEIYGAIELIGCTVAAQPVDGVIEVFPPSWRADLTGPEHLVEEVARLIGYDQIPSVLPVAPAGRGLTVAQVQRRSVSRALAEAGLVETLSYPFVSAAQFDELRYADDDGRRQAVRLLNPLSDAQPLLRTGVLMTLLQTARRNVARGLNDVAVYECGSASWARPSAQVAPQLPSGVRPSDEDLDRLVSALPHQDRQVAGVLVGNRVLDGWWGAGRAADWSDAIALVQLVARTVGATINLASDVDTAPWHPGRCARFTLADGTDVGFAGELHPKVLENLALPPRSVGFEVDLDAMIAAAPQEPLAASMVSTYPVAKEDLAFVVAEEVTAQQLREVLLAAGGQLLEDVRLFDVFRSEQIGAGKKSLAFALRMRAADRTLDAQETAAIRQRAVELARELLGAALRG